MNIAPKYRPFPSTGKRPYRKQARAESERSTGEAILSAALAAFADEPFERVTLRHIAEASGVTVQTVIRRFGSKEKLFEALVEREKPRILASREAPDGGGRRAALESLVHHYETDGNLILNLVAQEQQLQVIGEAVELGRRLHREWVERHCDKVFEGHRGAKRRRALLAAIAATDLSTWKVLRRDLGLDEAEVVEVMDMLLEGLARTEKEKR